MLKDSFLSQLVPDRLVEAFDPGKLPVESSHLASEIFQDIHRVLKSDIRCEMFLKNLVKSYLKAVTAHFRGV